MNSADMVPSDHISRLVAAVVDEIDVSGEEAQFVGTPGNPAYPRRMLLRLMVMSAVDGIFSSRKISKLARENVIYIHLTGNKQPDFRTICIFRRRNEKLIEEVFCKTVLIARAIGILNLGHLATDGTRIKAYAANANSLSREEIERIRAIIKRGIEIDEDEDKLYGDKRGDELPPELDTKEKIREKIREIEEKEGKIKDAGKRMIERHATGDERQKRKVESILDKAEAEVLKSGQESVSLIDPESRYMAKPRGWKELAYCSQITVDLASKIVLANDVCQDSCDYWQLLPQLEKTENLIGKLKRGTKFSADNGYYSGRNLSYLEERKLDGYIPDEKWAARANGRDASRGKYSKRQFYYSIEGDCFICPQGRTLTRGSVTVTDSAGLTYYYNCADCTGCPVRKVCADGEQNRRINSRGFEAERKRMAVKMESEKGKAVYDLRDGIEPVFGDIKQNMKHREFVMRGLKGAKAEFSLACTAHNLKLMWNQMGRKIELVRSAAGTAAGAAILSRRALFLWSKSGC